MSSIRFSLLILITVSHAVLLGGCAAVIGVGAAAGATALYDRRTTGTFIDDELIELKSIDALGRDEELWSQSHINVTSFNNIGVVHDLEHLQAYKKTHNLCYYKCFVRMVHDTHSEHLDL